MITIESVAVIDTLIDLVTHPRDYLLYQSTRIYLYYSRTACR